MNAFTIFLLVSLVVVVCAAPKDFQADHPGFLARPYPKYVKGQAPSVKGGNPAPYPSLRKGEYMCGDKVCRLRPGEVPVGCNGMCQYPVK